MKIEKNIRYYTQEKDLLDIYYPDNWNNEVIIDFHGGGFTSGDKDYMEDLYKDIVKHGYVVVGVNYSLYPHTKFPNYLKESRYAIKFVLDYLKIKHPYIAGHSAGAYIAMMLCFNEEYLKEVGINPLDIKGWIFESGQPTSHFNIMSIEKGVDPYLQRIDEMAPLYYVNKDTKLSKSLFILYSHDLPNRLEQNKLLISAVKHYYKEADITFKLIEGEHCQGCNYDESIKGFAYNNALLEWLE